jgi:hypothetical protein
MELRNIDTYRKVELAGLKNRTERKLLSLLSPAKNAQTLCKHYYKVKRKKA